MRKFISYLLASIVIILGSVFTYYYNSQEKLIFKGESLPRDYPFQTKYPYKEIFLKTKNEGEVHGLLFQQTKSKGVVLFLHGQGKNLKSRMKTVNFFLDRGLDLLIIDYRGFGKSSPGFKESWFLEDSDLAYHFLLNNYDENQIIIYGQSLGTSVATWLASQHTPKMLVLESPFYNMIMASHYTKPFLPKWILEYCLLKYPLRTDLWIQNVRVPIYMFHGREDQIVPFQHSLKDLDQIKVIDVPGRGHNDLTEDPIYQSYLTKILQG